MDQWRSKLEELRIRELKKIQNDDTLESRVCDLMNRFSMALVERILCEPVKPVPSAADAIHLSSQLDRINELSDLDSDQPFS